jgi:1-acyl-sn-glycerol-3-phosphate acyltransferase
MNLAKLRVRPSFPVGPPTWPKSVERLPVERTTGVHYDTAWSRRYPARLARALIVDDVLRPLVYVLGKPEASGLDRIAELDPPAIFVCNHQSHLDTALLLTALPARFRHHAVVGAAADYFFTSPVRSALSALSIGAIPIERHRVNRRSSDLAAELIADGWSLVVFPEGGRSPDGWAQEFRGGAAYLSVRSRRPVVPVYAEGTRRVLKKGDRYPTPVGRPFARGSGVHLVFGRPLWPEVGEDSRRFALRVAAAVAEVGDERNTDWWSARRRAAAGTTPSLSGPPVSAWRRAWALRGDEREHDQAPTWP